VFLAGCGVAFPKALHSDRRSPVASHLVGYVSVVVGMWVCSLWVCGLECLCACALTYTDTHTYTRTHT